jgi:TatD DNase family protein
VFVDSHAHLTSKDFAGDREAVISRAIDAGVAYIVNPAVDVADSYRAIELAEKHASVFACVGVHPHQASHADEKALSIIEELSAHPKVVAIGEIGLDYFYDFAPKDVQQRVFRHQIEIAQRHNLPVVIHTRESIDDTVRIVGEGITLLPSWRTRGHDLPGARGVFHCFSGDLAMANKVIGMRFYVSFPGMVTFKKAEMAQSVAAAIPLDDLLLETDSPYLAPVPHRGSRNEPANIPLIAKKIAELQGQTVDDVARMTSFNVHDLFGIGEEEPMDAA